MSQNQQKNQQRERTRLTQSFYCIKKRVPLSSVLHLGNWEFKLYAVLLEHADKNEVPDGDWIWKPFNLHELLGISRSTTATAISKLKAFGLIETFSGMLFGGSQDGKITLVGTPNGKVKANYAVRLKHGVERLHRDRLQKSIGGIAEVEIPVGRIDLLTDTEVIEVKRIEHWKSALGWKFWGGIIPPQILPQVLVYSAFYPQHQKRLHLFGTAVELEALANIEAAVLVFEVKVTGEEV